MSKIYNTKQLRPMQPQPAAPAKITAEEAEQKIMQAIMQKRESIALGILYNALHGIGGGRIDGDGLPDYRPAVHAALQAADEMIEALYSYRIRLEKKSDTKED